MRRRYGAGPAHLLVLLGAFALAAYVVSRVRLVPHHWQIGLYFALALVVNDLALYPLTAAADLLARHRHGRRRTPVVPWINHVRAPVLLAAVALMVSFPTVLRLAPDTYRSATGLTPTPFLPRYLGLCGVLFASSAALYALRLLAAHRRR